WRVPITHFTPWDCNWGFGPPEDAENPPAKNPFNLWVDDPNEECSSIIGVQEQTLGELLPLSGTPFTLHYQSERTPGRAHSLQIPVSAASIPASLRSIGVEVTIAGRFFLANFAAAPNLIYTLRWDGKDGYGRTLNGRQDVDVRIGFTYAGVYKKTERF